MKICMLVALGLMVASAGQAESLLVLNKGDATLVKMDPETGKILGRVATGDGPHEVVVSADGVLAVVANYGSRAPGNTLSVIDVASMKELHRVDLRPAERPHGLAVMGGKVWFTAEGSKLVGRYDPAANRVDSLLGTGQNGTHMVLFTKSEDKMFTANIAAGTVSVYSREGAAGWTQTVIPVGKGPEGMDLTPDGKELWVANGRDGSVSVIDVESGRVTATIDVGTKRSNRLKWTPDGTVALISDLDAGEILFLERQGRTVTKRLGIGKAPEGILITPDGLRAFVGVSGDDQVAVLDLNSREVKERYKPGKGPDGMAWVAAR